jgi:hypothetical protein
MPTTKRASCGFKQCSKTAKDEEERIVEKKELEGLSKDAAGGVVTNFLCTARRGHA